MKKKLLSVILASLFVSMFAIGVFGAKPFLDDTDSEKAEPLGAAEPSSAWAQISVGSQWWETYATARIQRTSTSYATMSGMTRSVRIPHAGHLEVRLTVEYAQANSDNAELRVKAVRGVNTYYGRPGNYWLGRGTHPARIYRTRTLIWAFERLPAGTYTVSVEWRAMNSGEITAVRDRIMTVTWIMYP